LQIGCDLEDPDIIGTTRECDVRSRYRSRAREFVEAGDKVQPADIPGSGIQERKVPVGGVRPAASLNAVVKSPLAVVNRAGSITEPAGPAASTA
jgi:hypothetical protein